MKTYLKQPIIILGAARSGTTMLGKIMSQHPDLAYWVEPKYIWNYNNQTNNHDRRTEEEAKEVTKNFIRKRFAEFLQERGKERLLEKTPSNCFRLPFIRAVFPDAKFIILIRDGRDVAFSAKKKWTSPPDRSAILRRITKLEIPLRDFPGYVTTFLKDTIGRMFFPQKGFVWGPRFPGIQQTRERYSVLETCAIQWRESVQTALKDLKGLDDSQYFKLKFEDFVRNPKPYLDELLEFTNLKYEKQIIDFAQSFVEPDVAFKWKERPSKEVEEFLELIIPLLERLDYPTSRS